MIQALLFFLLFSVFQASSYAASYECSGHNNDDIFIRHNYVLGKFEVSSLSTPIGRLGKFEVSLVERESDMELVIKAADNVKKISGPKKQVIEYAESTNDQELFISCVPTTEEKSLITSIKESNLSRNGI